MVLLELLFLFWFDAVYVTIFVIPEINKKHKAGVQLHNCLIIIIIIFFLK